MGKADIFFKNGLPETPPLYDFLERGEWFAVNSEEEGAFKTQREIDPAAISPLRKHLILEEVKDVGDEGDENDLSLEFVISTNDVDRDRDTIAVDGWDLTNFEKNPVVLFGHDYRNLPVARASETRVEDGKLKSVATFTPADVYDFGYTVYQMYKGGFMKAVSVGFLPTKWSFVEEDDRPFGVDFEEQELLEYSAVPVPSNASALLAASAAGIDIAPVKSWAAQVLDESSGEETVEVGAGFWVPRKRMEELHTAAKEASKPTAGRQGPAGDGYGGHSPASWTGGMPPRGSQGGQSKHPEGQVLGDANTITVRLDDVVNGKTVGQIADMARFFRLLTEIRVRATSLEDLKDQDLAGARSNAIRREANFLAAKLLPDFNAEEFEKLFPELCGDGEFVPGVLLEAKSGRVLSKANEDKLKKARDEIDAVLEQLGEAGEGEASEGDGDKDAPILGFLEPIYDEEKNRLETESYDPFADFGLGEVSPSTPFGEEVARE